MDSATGSDPALPLTPEVLADLQAGLLDDATAAHIRRRVRADPHAAELLAGLDAARRAVADLGAADAPDVPAEVVERIGRALRHATDERRR